MGPTSVSSNSLGYETALSPPPLPPVSRDTISRLFLLVRRNNAGDRVGEDISARMNLRRGTSINPLLLFFSTVNARGALDLWDTERR